MPAALAADQMAERVIECGWCVASTNGRRNLEELLIDATLPEKLLNLKSSAVLVDIAGHVVAVVHPRFDAAQYDVGLDLTPEEIERRCQPGRKTYSTEEVLAMLRKLP
jgi:hypothetical protein